MIQKTAPTSITIKTITSLVLLLTLTMLIAAISEPVLILPGIFLILIDFLSYLNAPLAYEINAGQLIVHYRHKHRNFGPALNCLSVADDRPLFSIRLWGNSGLFAATGIFWNKKYGIFRAYVTTGKKEYLLLIETERAKVIISPQQPEQFAKKNQHKGVK